MRETRTIQGSEMAASTIELRDIAFSDAEAFATAPTRGVWTHASLPFDVHTALVAAGRLQDPYRDDAAADAAWIAEWSWWIRASFELTSPDSTARLRLTGLLFQLGRTTTNNAAGSGPLSDRTGRKPFVIAGPLMLLLALVPLFFVAEAWAFVTFFAVGGLAYGSYLAVDAALMADILPSKERAAKDLAILNASNTLPAILRVKGVR